MQSAAGKIWDGVARAAHDIVERQEGSPPELDDHRLLGQRKDGAPGIARPHGCIARALAGSPLSDGFWVQLIAGREGPGAFLRPLELGSDTRRRSGAAVKNCCHSASSPSPVSVAPSHPGTKHLGMAPISDLLRRARRARLHVISRCPVGLSAGDFIGGKTNADGSWRVNADVLTCVLRQTHTLADPMETI
jgi:hypothetical protein